MFFKCQSDLPVAMIVTSAQQDWFSVGITITLSALTSESIFSTSATERTSEISRAAPAEEEEEKEGGFEAERPNSFHDWSRSDGDGGDLRRREGREEQRDRRAANIRFSVNGDVLGSISLFFLFALLK